MPDELIIRTMKDDIAEMNSPSAPTLPAPVLVPQIKSKTTKTPPVFSLPKAQDLVPAKKYTHIALGIGYIALFMLIIAGVVYGYMQWDMGKFTETISTKELAFFELIPKEALAIVDYNMEIEENRTKIADMWNEVRTAPEVQGIDGDPRGLLTALDISHIYYVLMPEEAEPFLIVKKTDTTKEYVSQQREEQLLEKGGWYVLHASNVEQYNAALANGSISEESLLVTPSDRSDYLARYAMSAAFVRQQFQTLAHSATGFSASDDLVFYITEPISNGGIVASAQVAGEPPGEGVVNETSELISLIPSDITFGHVGLNFAEKLSALDYESSRLDSNILTQPDVRQFISLFTTPYAIFERKGSDGVTDIGLIVALPSSLQKTLQVGEPIIEQALPALIPLIVGKKLDIQVTFNDGLYNGFPLRYVNLNGQTQTIDYAVGDNFLLVSSSREGMSALVDTSLAGKQGLSTEDPFKTLAEKAAVILKNKTFIAGSMNDPALLSVLPVLAPEGVVPFVVSSGKTSTGIDIQAVLLSK